MGYTVLSVSDAPKVAGFDPLLFNEDISLKMTLPYHHFSRARLRLFQISSPLVFVSLTLTTPALFAQITNIAIENTTLQPSVKRLGMNLGTVDFYDSGQMTQNLIMQNPGFEGNCQYLSYGKEYDTRCKNSRNS